MSRIRMVILIVLPMAFIVILSMVFTTRLLTATWMRDSEKNLLDGVIAKTQVIRKSMQEIAKEVDSTAMLLRSPNSAASDYVESIFSESAIYQFFLVAYDPSFLADLTAGKYPEYHLENFFGRRSEGTIPELYSPGFYRPAEGEVKYVDEAQGGYTFNNWFLSAQTLRRATWCEPGPSRLTKTNVCYYSAPFFYKGVFAGAVAAAFRVSQLVDEEHGFSLEMDNTLGDMFILSSHGKILLHSNQNPWNHESVYTLADDRSRDDIYPQLDLIFSSESGCLKVEGWGTELPKYKHEKSVWLVYNPLRNGTECVLVAAFGEKALFKPLRQQQAAIWVGGSLLLALLLLVVSIVIAFIFHPVLRMARVSNLVAEGNFNVLLPERYTTPNTAVGRLSTNFNRMILSLKENFETRIAEKTKNHVYERELEIARQVQFSLLPTPESFAENGEYLLDSLIRPARFVAGDFFDHWQIDDEHVAILIADVSGKGMPAAMITVAARTLLRQITMADKAPGEILNEVNRILVTTNRNYMFITMFFAFYNTRTGEMRYCNVGHTPAAIIGADQEVRWLSGEINTVLGIFPEVEFTTQAITLAPGETLFLYTDGVLDVRNERGELFGHDRLNALVEVLAPKPVHRFIPSLIEVLDHFGSAEQNDDITAIVLHRLHRGCSQENTNA